MSWSHLKREEVREGDSNGNNSMWTACEMNSNYFNIQDITSEEDNKCVVTPSFWCLVYYTNYSETQAMPLDFCAEFLRIPLVIVFLARKVRLKVSRKRIRTRNVAFTLSFRLSSSRVFGFHLFFKWSFLLYNNRVNYSFVGRTRVVNTGCKPGSSSPSCVSVEVTQEPPSHDAKNEEAEPKEEEKGMNGWMHVSLCQEDTCPGMRSLIILIIRLLLLSHAHHSVLRALLASFFSSSSSVSCHEE